MLIKLNKSLYFIIHKLVFVCLFCIPFSIKAQNPIDSVKISNADSIALAAKHKIDSLGLKPFKKHGSFSVYDEISSFNITKKDLLWQNYYTFGEIVSNYLPVFPIILSNPGEYESFSIFGGMAINNGAYFNGRSIGDYDYGSFNFARYSPEAFENAEIYVGSDAAIFSGNSGMSVNFKEIIYNTAKPYTRLAYSQGGSGFLSADGVYSQNIAQNTNFTFGFKSMNTDGSFLNSYIKTWNVRVNLRYNLDSLSSISLNESFNNHGSARNGGVNPELSVDKYDANQAYVYFTNLFENLIRHDITLTYSKIADTSGLFAFQSSIYGSFIENVKNYKTDALMLKFDSSGSKIYSYNYFGATSRVESKYKDYIKLIAGIDANYVQFDDNIFLKGKSGLDLSLFARGELSPWDAISLSGGARLRNAFGKTLASVGLKSTFNFTKSINFIIDASRSENLPSFAQGIDLKPEENLLGLAYLNLYYNGFKASIGGFARKLNNPIVGYSSIDNIKPIHYENCDCETVYGGFIKFESKIIESIKYVIEAQSYYGVGDSLKEKFLPALYLKAKTEYNYKIGRSEVFAGLSIGLLAPYKGYTFTPITGEFIYYPYESKWTFNGGSIYAHLKLGDAYLKIDFENALNIGYSYVPGYPVVGRNFHVTLFWAFGN